MTLRSEVQALEVPCHWLFFSSSYIADTWSDTVPYKKRQALFPGVACVNLSPTQGEKFQDQLGVILQVMGTPSSEDIAALQSQEASEEIARRPTYTPKV